LIGVGLVNAQQRSVTGKVTSADDGQPIIGATVMVKGTTTGTITNADGNFVLTVPSGSRVLVVTYVGMKSSEVNLTGSSVYNVSLESDAIGIEEVVVVGYGTQLKRDVTSSISKVKGNELADKASPSFVQQLAGRAAGVQITQSSGDLGTPPNIRIRGVNTISSGSQPLIVVNGVPVTSGNIGGSYTNNNPLADINPSDIESIEILKDGAATAIYGSRASNGVMLVTTKKGSMQKTKVTYDAWFANSQASKLYNLLNAEQFVEIANEKNSNINSTAKNAVMDAEGTNTNWNDHVFRNGFQQSHNLSVAGGTDDTQFYLSAGYSDQQGIVINNSFKRYTFNSSVDQKLFKWLKAGISLNGSVQNNTGPIKGVNSLSDNMYAVTRMLPNVKVYNPDHPTGYNIDFTSPKSLGRGANLVPIDLTVPNIVWVLKTNKQFNESYRIMPTAYLELTPIKGLVVKSLIGTDISLVDDLYAWYPQSGDGQGYKGLINETNYTRKRWTFQNIANYKTTIAEDHNLDLTGVAEWSKYTYRYVYAGARDMSSDFFMPYIISSTFNTQSSGGFYTHNGIASYLFRANYNWKNNVYLGGSYRRDGLSKLPANNRWGDFYGGSAAVRLSGFDFWEPIKEYVNDFKLRASYAQVGNDDIGNFTYLDQFSSQLYGSQTGISYYTTGNPNLRWEKQNILDYGFDMALFDRVNVSVAFWKKVNTDIVLDAPTPPSLGIPWNVISQNIGSVENNGMEIEIGGTVVKTKDFSYNASVNFSTQHNKVTKLISDMKYEHYIIREGESMRSLYGYVYEGVNMANGFPMYKKADGTIIQGNPNDSKYYVYNADSPATLGAASSLSADDKKVLGNTIPTWFGGFDNTFRYQNFDLNIFFRFSGGNKIANVTRRDLLNMYFQNNGTEILDRWQSADKPGNGQVPIIQYGRGNFLNLESDGSSRWVERGDFLKLQNVSLGYTLPKNITNMLTLSQVRCYVQAQNLLTITPYSGLDPEVYTSAMGIDWNGNPQQRSITFGLNVVF
jgi:TonB-linked SusC/RagA family outer membrane protein